MIAIKDKKGNVLVAEIVASYAEAKKMFRNLVEKRKNKITILEGSTTDDLNIVIVSFPNGLYKRKFFDTRSEDLLSNIDNIKRTRKRV